MMTFLEVSDLHAYESSLVISDLLISLIKDKCYTNTYTQKHLMTHHFHLISCFVFINMYLIYILKLIMTLVLWVDSCKYCSLFTAINAHVLHFSRSFEWIRRDADEPPLQRGHAPPPPPLNLTPAPQHGADVTQGCYLALPAGVATAITGTHGPWVTLR